MEMCRGSTCHSIFKETDNIYILTTRTPSISEHHLLTYCPTCYPTHVHSHVPAKLQRRIVFDPGDRLLNNELLVLLRGVQPLLLSLKRTIAETITDVNFY